jgi:regulator of cell morphogenesis and NO signaling
MLIQKETKVGEAVAANFRAARIFEQYGIDFCCGGKKSIAEACISKGLDPEHVLTSLTEIHENGTSLAENFNLWKPDFLIDYIVNNHHSYVEKMLPVIYMHSQKVADKHRLSHPETAAIAGLFISIKEELEVHMQKEERVLFPYIKTLLKMEENGEKAAFPPFGTVENPIRMMESEHETAGNLMAEINSLSSGFTPPEDACATFKVLYSELKEFENDLHTHIHLENNILFPKAIALEKKIIINKPHLNN